MNRYSSFEYFGRIWEAQIHFPCHCYNKDVTHSIYKKGPEYSQFLHKASLYRVLSALEDEKIISSNGPWHVPIS